MLIEPTKMTREGLKRFVLGLANGQIFTSAHLHPSDGNLLGMVFMVLGLFGPDPGRPTFQIVPTDHAPLTEEQREHYLKHVGVYWEWFDKAGPRAINGYPMFSSHRVMHIDDWKRAHAAYLKELERREDIDL